MNLKKKVAFTYENLLAWFQSVNILGMAFATEYQEFPGPSIFMALFSLGQSCSISFVQMIMIELNLHSQVCQHAMITRLIDIHRHFNRKRGRYIHQQERDGTTPSNKFISITVKLFHKNVFHLYKQKMHLFPGHCPLKLQLYVQWE